MLKQVGHIIAEVFLVIKILICIDRQNMKHILDGIEIMRKQEIIIRHGLATGLENKGSYLSCHHENYFTHLDQSNVSSTQVKDEKCKDGMK